MKETVTYLIKRNDVGDDLYITNRPSDNFPEIKYSTNFKDAREFDGVDKTVIDMKIHAAIKHRHIEDDIYEEVEYDI